jgi:peptide-methionine (S)-S-oxide reductase
MEVIYFSGGCLWGVQEFIKHIPGVIDTEAGRANGRNNFIHSEYDGYAECVRTVFDPEEISIEKLLCCFFEIIDPYSINKQGNDIGMKYRTGVYSECKIHLSKASNYIAKLKIKLNEDNKLIKNIAVEVLDLTNYIASDAEHQDRLTRYPDEYCHIPLDLLYKYRKNNNVM